MTDRKIDYDIVLKNLRNVAYWIDIYREYEEDLYHDVAVKLLCSAVTHLGYRLVPITTPQQEHDALLAARVAEDGPPPVTSAPGFDGRDSSIGMREQDIEGTAV